MGRKLVIGDIHGNLVALKQVMERAGVTAKDKLIFLGDYVDGWPESAQVVEYLLNLENECIFIKGNHDHWCGEWLNLGKREHMWVIQGGQATIDSYVSSEHLASEAHKNFFKNLQLYHVDDKDNVFVHGGFLGRKITDMMNNPSDYYWCRDQAKHVMAAHRMGGDKPKGKLHDHEGTLFIGHTQTTSWGKEYTEPIVMNGVALIDTGAGYLHGKLTIMNIDNTDEYWQSDLCTGEWPYPGHWGRG